MNLDNYQWILRHEHHPFMEKRVQRILSKEKKSKKRKIVQRNSIREKGNQK
jgi:hypothetical protein